jgi:hypothetical protein
MLIAVQGSSQPNPGQLTEQQRESILAEVREEIANRKK